MSVLHPLILCVTRQVVFAVADAATGPYKEHFQVATL